MINQKNNFEKGVTLVELLLVVSILAIALSTIPMFTKSGDLAWNTEDNKAEVTQNALIGMDKLVRELKQSRSITEVSDSSNSFGYIQYVERDGTSEKRFRYNDGYLEFGDTDALDRLAGPIGSLKFTCYDINGSVTTDVNEIKSIMIELTTTKNGISVPLTSRVFIHEDVAGFSIEDGSSGGGGGEGGGGGGSGDSEGGLGDFAIFGKEGVSISNSVTIAGNVGTHGNLLWSVNSTSITGDVVVSGSFSGSNSATITGNLYTRNNIDMKNSSTIFGNIYTNGNVTMRNSARVTGNITHPSGTTITLYNSATYGSQSAGSPPYTKFLTVLPPAESFTVGTEDIKLTNSASRTLEPGAYRNLSLSNSSRVYLSSGTYYFNSITMANSSIMSIDLAGGPIQIYVMGRVRLYNSSSIIYTNAGPNGGADKVYVETLHPYSPNYPNAWSCENSVHWRGTVYAPYAGISFYNSSNCIGALYSGKTVTLGNSVPFTHVRAINLPSKFNI
ncbi:MAG: prepilin-type N-terminal cleavage/methylation domain-containing protein [bacterium]